MKKRVKYSVAGWVYSIALIMLCLGLTGMYYINGRYIKMIGISTLFVAIIIAALIYAPLYIRVTDHVIIVRRPLGRTVIDIDNVESVRLCQPTLSARRVGGSSGFFGSWGWFKERTIGKYFGYYGRLSDCFLLTLKDGRRYLLGCEDPTEVVDFIRHLTTH